MELNVAAYESALAQLRLASFAESKHPRDLRGRWRPGQRVLLQRHGKEYNAEIKHVTPTRLHVEYTTGNDKTKTIAVAEHEVREAKSYGESSGKETWVVTDTDGKDHEVLAENAGAVIKAARAKGINPRSASKKR